MVFCLALARTIAQPTPTIDTIGFDLGRAHLNWNALCQLNHIAAIDSASGTTIAFSYTPIESGLSTYPSTAVANLIDRRINMVADYMVARGVDSLQIQRQWSRLTPVADRLLMIRIVEEELNQSTALVSRLHP